jgi:hypothetical protein
MQGEIDAEGWPTPVHLLGVNGMGHESGNAATVDGRVIPWLQDTPEEHAWWTWEVAYRDVVILDGDHIPVATFNLTTFNLSNSVHYDSLKTLLREASQAE